MKLVFLPHFIHILHFWMFVYSPSPRLLILIQTNLCYECNEKLVQKSAENEYFNTVISMKTVLTEPLFYTVVHNTYLYFTHTQNRTTLPFLSENITSAHFAEKSEIFCLHILL